MVAGALCAHVFIRRLSELQELNVSDERALSDIIGPGREVSKGQDIVAEGSAPTSVSIVVSGVASRYKVVPGASGRFWDSCFPGTWPMISEAAQTCSITVSARRPPAWSRKFRDMSSSRFWMHTPTLLGRCGDILFSKGRYIARGS